MSITFARRFLFVACALAFLAAAVAQDIQAVPVDKWVTVEGQAAGTGLAAQDEAVAKALRRAVEEACGTFLTAQSESQDYKLVYDKVFASTVGYVVEHKVKKIWIADDITHASVTARVSTQKFESDWTVIAHTVRREGNPRVIIAVTDATWSETAPADASVIAGVVQGKIEDFFLAKGLQLVDRDTAAAVNKRDIILAGMKDDVRELAALGARFKADVVIYGQSSARYGSTMQIAGHDAHKFVATLNARAIRTDSAQLMVSKTFGPITITSLQYGGGREQALAKLAEEAAPELLKAVVEAWRKQIHVTRNIRLEVSGMTYEEWQTFRKEAQSIRGVQAMQLREITEGVANIDVEYDFDTQTLADRIGELKEIKLTITEFNPNRLKLKVVK